MSNAVAGLLLTLPSLPPHQNKSMFLHLFPTLNPSDGFPPEERERGKKFTKYKDEIAIFTFCNIPQPVNFTLMQECFFGESYTTWLSFPFFFEYGATTHPKNYPSSSSPHPSMWVAYAFWARVVLCAQFFGYASPLGQLREGRWGKGNPGGRIKKREVLPKQKPAHTVVLHNIYFPFFSPGNPFFVEKSGKANKCRYYISSPFSRYTVHFPRLISVGKIRLLFFPLA